MKITKKGNYLIMNGKWYVFNIPIQDGDFNTGDWEMTEVKKPKELNEKINKITEEIFESLDREIIMKDALFDMTPIEIEVIYQKLFKNKRKPKLKMKKHCIQLDVGGIGIPIR
jgi:hypothetical protein